MTCAYLLEKKEKRKCVCTHQETWFTCVSYMVYLHKWDMGCLIHALVSLPADVGQCVWPDFYVKHL